MKTRADDPRVEVVFEAMRRENDKPGDGVPYPASLRPIARAVVAALDEWERGSGKAAPGGDAA